MSKIKAVHIKDRTVENLIVGGVYYISFDGKKAYKVELLDINDTMKMGSIKVLNGKFKGKFHSLYLDEIRSTEEAACKNYVTL